MRDIAARIPGFEPAPTRRTSGSCAHLRDPRAWPSTCRSLRPCKAFAFTDTRTMIYAGRVVMIGWSWLLDRHLFIAAAAGRSVGRESGAQESRTDDGSRMMSTFIARQATTTEGYPRFGAAIDL